MVLTALIETAQFCSSKVLTRVAPPMRAGLLRCWWSLTTHRLSTENRFLKLTWEDDVQVHALRKRGWTISAIRQAYRPRPQDHPDLSERDQHHRSAQRSAVDPFELFLAYVTARPIDDPHLWVRTLCDELETATDVLLIGRGRQDSSLGRIGKGCSTCRLSHVLHDCRRPRRPVPPRRDRRQEGHHDAVLRRPDAARDRPMPTPQLCRGCGGMSRKP